ncbi:MULTISPECIES: hypothetical protein [unclassified Diaminobutyricimonas]|uniref:hypothetical protein n=1 Tax=unclassified Diaminobutyricimonas TaxID=2643261 RepID=UPI0012F517E2|nr:MULTISPECIES: hypothetical protein [unclassified Diaminobutyricimonas]
MTHGAVTKRFISAAALAGAFALGLSGCSYVTPQATTVEYSASDGVNGTVGDVQISNLLALSEDGADVALVGRLMNNGDSNAQVKIASVDFPEISTTVSVPEGEYVDLGADESFILEDIDGEVGGDLHLFVQYGDSEPTTLNVPVLDGALPEYEQYLP